MDIASQFGIVTPYTAYLAEEPDLAFRDDMRLRRRDGAVRGLRRGARRRQGGGRPRRRAGTSARRRGLVGQQRGAGRRRTHLLPRRRDLDARRLRAGDGVRPRSIVGSDEFRALLADDPSWPAPPPSASASSTLGPDGWVTLVWPDVDAGLASPRCHIHLTAGLDRLRRSSVHGLVCRPGVPAVRLARVRSGPRASPASAQASSVRPDLAREALQRLVVVGRREVEDEVGEAQPRHRPGKRSAICSADPARTRAGACPGWPRGNRRWPPARPQGRRG